MDENQTTHWIEIFSPTKTTRNLYTKTKIYLLKTKYFPTLDV